MNIINNSRVVRQSKLETEPREVPEGIDPIKLCMEITEDFGAALSALFSSANEHDIELTDVQVALSVDPTVTPHTVKFVVFAHGLGYDDPEIQTGPEDEEQK